MSTSYKENSPLTDRQVQLVKESWSKLTNKTDRVSTSFYKRLFELDDGMISVFEDTDMEAQGKKFTDTITFIVMGLDQFDLLGPAIGELGKRHISYGVKNDHYLIVKEALLDALESESPSTFSKDTLYAWEATYDAMAEIMRKGSNNAPLTSPGL